MRFNEDIYLRRADMMDLIMFGWDEARIIRCRRAVEQHFQLAAGDAGYC